MSAAKAAVPAQGIILHAGALPLQVHAKRACGGVVHHMQLQINIAFLEALNRVQHAHAGMIQHNGGAEHRFGKD